jgi:hypothetical protein
MIDAWRVTPNTRLMKATRLLLAAVIAVAVAMSPASGGAAFPSMHSAMSQADHSDMPCCPADDCKGSIDCAFKCFSLMSAVLPAPILLPDPVMQDTPLLVGGTLRGHVVSPPTHPPSA